MGNSKIDPRVADATGKLSPVVMRPPVPPYNVLILTNDTADADYVTIGSTTYEFDTGGAVTSGNVSVDVSGGATPTLSMTALETAINARLATDGWLARKISANELIVIKQDGGSESTATSFTSSFTNVNNNWVAATSRGASDGGVMMDVQSRTVHADEIATTNGCLFVVPFVPDRVVCYFLDASASNKVITDTIPTITGYGSYAVVNVEESATAYAASDVIVMVAFKG